MHNNRVAIIIFYIKNDNFLRQNLIKIFTKMHQITYFLIIFSGEHAPNPQAKRMEQHANL